MEDVAETTRDGAHELTGPASSRVTGITVREVLELPALAGVRVLGGNAGLGRVVARVNVMEVPDILPWVKPDELLLTTGYPLRGWWAPSRGVDWPRWPSSSTATSTSSPPTP